MDTIKIILPTLGESLSEATVAKWLKNPGDLIEKDEAIVEIETDKATQELYAESSGTLSEVYVQEGSDIEVGAIIGTITPRDLNVDSSIDVSEQTSTLSVSNKEINESPKNHEPSTEILVRKPSTDTFIPPPPPKIPILYPPKPNSAALPIGLLNTFLIFLNILPKP